MKLKLGGWELGLSPATITNFRQNSPELIIRDAERMLNLNEEQCWILRQILLARGVNKWFKARRDIIKLKHKLKEDIKTLLKSYDRSDIKKRTTLRCLIDFSQKLQEICHQSRWVEWPKIGDARKAEKRLIVKGPSM